MWIPWLLKEKSLDDFVDHDGETRLSQLMEDSGTARPEDSVYKKELVDLTRQCGTDRNLAPRRRGPDCGGGGGRAARLRLQE